MEILQYNPFIHLIYANKKRGEKRPFPGRALCWWAVIRAVFQMTMLCLASHVLPDPMEFRLPFVVEKSKLREVKEITPPKK
jgi:hypothetical protein